MKKVLFLTAAIAAVFVSCSNNDDDTPPPAPAFTVAIEKAIEGNWNEDLNESEYTYEPIESIVFTAKDDGYFEIRIKADVDWILDETSIPSLFREYGFKDENDNMIGAKANVFSEIITLKIMDEAQLETLPSKVAFKVKDVKSAKSVDVEITLPGVGDSFISRTDGGEEVTKVAKTGVQPLVFEFSYSPAYNFKVVVMEGNTTGAMTAIKEATWVTAVKTETRAPLSKVKVTCTVQNNPGEPRGAVLYAIPTSASINDVFEYDEQGEMYQIKPAFEDKAFNMYASISQVGTVTLTFENSTSSLTKTYSAEAVTGSGPFDPGVRIALTTTAPCSDQGADFVAPKKGVTIPAWVLNPFMNNSPKEFTCNLEANTGAERTAVVEFYHYTSYEDNTGTKLATLTIVQAALTVPTAL